MVLGKQIKEKGSATLIHNNTSLLAQGNVVNKHGEDKEVFIIVKRKEKIKVGKGKLQLIWIHVTNHQCEVEATTQAGAQDKEMEVDGNKEQGASKEKVEGHQIPPY
jgi:hypothetical protein